MADRLHKRRKSLTVKKNNRGEITNIKYDKDKKLMRALDSLIRMLFAIDSEYPFHAAKENSIAGHDLHFDKVK